MVGAIVCFPFSSWFSAQQCFSACQNSLPLDSLLSCPCPSPLSPFSFHLFPFSLSSLAKGKHSLFSKESLTLCTSLFSHLFSQNFYSFLITQEPCVLSPFTGLITSTLWCCLWVGMNRSSGLSWEPERWGCSRGHLPSGWVLGIFTGNGSCFSLH